MKKLNSIPVLTFLLFSLFVLVNCNTETEPIDQDQLSSIINKLNNDNVIEIRSDKNDQYIFSNTDGFENAFASRVVPGDIVCEGSGISFARCVRRNLDAGKLLKLYKKDGVYYAEEM
jgi:hypothetical protein